MLFNSLSFAIFLPIVFGLYWFACKGSLKWQNLLLLAASYFFYACWDYRFLFLLIFSTFLDYYTGFQIHKANNSQHKKLWLWFSIVVNVGVLLVFKYYNFFTGSFSYALSFIGLKTNFGFLEVILPIGISFYTFHGLSYVIDNYYNRIQPERNFVNYSLFVSFFPLLVAGPIERATHLLPQISNPRVFDYHKAVDGLRQILWGLFKKIVIADNCATYANLVFNDSANYSGSTLLVGALFFTFQIYCDFSGYSDIALGTARLFGIELLRNFAFPYFSKDFAEFWRRWHISLSSWFRDYIYIPLGGNKNGILITIRNTFIVFLLSGLWHGANWTFVVWGLLNALFVLPTLFFKSKFGEENNHNYSLISIVSMLVTFGLTVFAWIFFRCTSIHQATAFVKEICSASLFTIPHFEGIANAIPTVILTILFIIIEWICKDQSYAIANLGLNWKRPLRHTFYYVLLIIIFFFGNYNGEQFVYFQF